MGKIRSELLIVIIASIIGAIVTSFFAGVFDNLFANLLNGPDVLIDDIIKKRLFWVNNPAYLEIVVLNQGTKAAEGCYVVFTDGLDPNQQWKSSNIFSIPAGEKKSMDVTTDKYLNVGTYTFEAYVTCKNFVASKHDVRDITIEQP